MERLKNNITSFFNDLHFVEDSHEYFIHGKKLKTSVSKLTKRFEEEVDWTAIREGLSFKTNKSPEEIKKEWDLKSQESCALGTRTHLFGEKYAIDRTLLPKSPFEEAIVAFWKDLPTHIVVLSTELQMYHKKYLFAGTADIILYNTVTNEIYIADYKTNIDLFKNFKLKRLLSPFSRFLDTPFSFYILQLSLYQILIEQVPNIKISKRKIIWLKPNGTYELYDTEDCTEELQKELYLIFN